MTTNVKTIHFNLIVNQHGQITLPKSLRKLMGLEKGHAVSLVASPTSATFERAETIEEVLASLDAKRPQNIQAKITELSGKTASELRDDYVKSPAGQAHYKEKYHVA